MQPDILVGKRVNQLVSAFQVRPEQETDSLAQGLNQQAETWQACHSVGRPLVDGKLLSSQLQGYHRATSRKTGPVACTWAGMQQPVRSRSSEGGSAGVGAA